MNEKNFEYLSKQMRGQGFEHLIPELKKILSQPSPPEQFSLKDTAGYDGDKMSYELNFNYSKETGYYHFNNFRATLTMQEEFPGNEVSQTFYKEYRITKEEAYNLLMGRAAYKEGLKTKKKEGKKQVLYNAWAELDFTAEKDKHGNYPLILYTDYKHFNEIPFRVAEAIENLSPLLQQPLDTLLQDSLERGNIHEVTHIDGRKLLLVAEPKERRLHLFDEDGKTVAVSEQQQPLPKESEKLSEQAVPEQSPVDEKKIPKGE